MFKITEKIEAGLGDCVKFKVKCLSCGRVSTIPSHWQFFTCEDDRCDNHDNLWEMREEWELTADTEVRTELTKLLGRW